MGGQTWTQTFNTDQEAIDFADQLWNAFGANIQSGVERPFDDAVVDGFDLGIGNDGNGWTAFASRMRDNYISDQSKTYYISATLQCPILDINLNSVIFAGSIDFIFVQFYSCKSRYYGADKSWNGKWQCPNPNV